MLGISAREGPGGAWRPGGQEEGKERAGRFLTQPCLSGGCLGKGWGGRPSMPSSPTRRSSGLLPEGSCLGPGCSPSSLLVLYKAPSLPLHPFIPSACRNPPHSDPQLLPHSAKGGGKGGETEKDRQRGAQTQREQRQKD